MDLMVTLYEAYERHSLFVFKALACKGYIRLDDNTFSETLNFFEGVEKQIKAGRIRTSNLSGKKKEFIAYLMANTSDLYAYTASFFFDLEDFYGKKKN